MIFAGTGLDDFRMQILRVTIELYMMITNRNTDQWHTDRTISDMEAKLHEWTELVKQLICDLEASGKKVCDMNIPKVHDLQHLIEMTRLKGLPLFHSTEG